MQPLQPLHVADAAGQFDEALFEGQVTAHLVDGTLGEHLTALKLAGFALAAAGVWLVTRPGSAASR